MRNLVTLLLFAAVYFFASPGKIFSQDTGDFDNGFMIPRTNSSTNYHKFDSVYFHNPNTGKIMAAYKADITLWYSCPMKGNMTKCLGSYLFVNIQDIGTYYFYSREDVLEKYESTNRRSRDLADGGKYIIAIDKGPDNIYDKIDDVDYWNWYYIIIPNTGIPMTLVQHSKLR